MSRRPPIKVFEARRRLTLAVFAMAAAGLLVRAVYLQVLERGFLRHEAQLRHERVVEVPAYRGMITDRSGEPFAVSAPVDSIWANPAMLTAERPYLEKIARILELDYGELYSRLAARGDREFVYLKRHVRPDIAERVMELKAPGVNVQREYRRYYPTGEVTGHVLGFTDIDDRGQEGLELAYDDWLRGQSGRHRIIQDRTGRAVEHVERISDPDPGQDLTLSIDRRLQYLAYRELAAAVQYHDAISGSAVMLDPFTGEILAMVNQPAFNPNNRDDRAGSDFRNRAVTDVFEPGSAIKPFTVAAALESGVYRPASRIDTAPGRLRVSGHAIHDVRDYGVLDLAGILRKSSNVGATKIALSLDPVQLWRMLQGVGLGARTGVGFPGESSGFLAHYARWYPLDQATMGFGYGVSVTALQLARAYGVLAADGLLVRPTLVLAAAQPHPTRVMSAATAHQLLAMLETVVGPEGTAPRARVRGYRVAGKTGTARKSEAGGYADDRYVAVFAGIAPASRPRLVMVIVINEPRRNGYYGGQVAAPVFARVMGGALRLLDVSPDDLPALQAATVSGEGRS
jgi:cell division protein FtsI (penicillin-binding protein 3)